MAYSGTALAFSYVLKETMCTVPQHDEDVLQDSAVSNAVTSRRITFNELHLNKGK
jgi:hypothetical protein